MTEPSSPTPEVKVHLVPDESCGYVASIIKEDRDGSQVRSEDEKSNGETEEIADLEGIEPFYKQHELKQEEDKQDERKDEDIGDEDIQDEDDEDIDLDDIDDLDELDDEIIDLPSVIGSRDHSGISKTDANSLLGGEVIDSHSNKKIFAFQLPFGGTFSSIKTNIYQKLPNFSLFNKEDGFDDNIKQDIRLRLSRQQSINTINEANYFKYFKGRDDVRFRAVKHSLASKYNDMIPHKNVKDMEDYESIFSKLTGNIVILGGYRGSILRDTRTKKRIWIPIKAGFHLRKVNLLLGPRIDDEINAVRYMYPDGVLKNIGPIDLCKSLIKKLDTPYTNVKEFGYDWRLSGEHVANQLEQFLQDLYDETGEPSLVICHSMGGLITHRTVHKNPKLFKAVLYVGVPSECLNILGPIRTGESVLFSDKILTAEANFMMRSSFNFLPLSGRVFYNRETHEPYVLDLFDPDTWVEYNLNPLVAKTRLLKKSSALQSGTTSNSLNSTIDSSISTISSKLRAISVRSLSPLSRSPLSETFNLFGAGETMSMKPPVFNADEDGLHIPFDEAYTYLADSLKKAKAFLEDLDFKEELKHEYPPMAIVYGNTVPSVRGSHVTNEQDIKDGNYYDFFYGHGDGVVHQKWLMPERRGFEVFNPKTGEGQIVGKFATTTGHVNLMTDLKAMGKALNALHDAQKVWGSKELTKQSSLIETVTV